MIKATLYLLHYNNYYNRIVKKEDTLEAYQQYVIGDPIQNVNFIPNDFINTEQIVNWQDEDPDYLIVADEDNNIVSRWFVVDTLRTRAGQLRLTLHRDLVVDFYSNIINAPCFIEKATLNNSDPMIFNSEDMTFNQIKTSETTLKDETESAWVVGYIPKDSLQNNTTVNADVILENSADITVNGLSSWDYWQYANGQEFRGYETNIKHVGYTATHFDAPFNSYDRMAGFGIESSWSRDDFATCFYMSDDGGGTNYNSVTTPSWTKNGLFTGYTGTNSLMSVDSWDESTFLRYLRMNCPNGWYDHRYEILNASKAFTGCHTVSETNSFTALENKIIYDSSSGLYYRIKMSSRQFTEQKDVFGNLFILMRNYLQRKTGFGVSNGRQYELKQEPYAGNFQLKYTCTVYNLRLEQIFTGATTVINNNRYHLEDQPYDIFCIPYSNDLKIYKNGTEILTANKSIAVSVATAIGQSTGSNNIYDIQLLPYCPVRYCIRPDGTFDIGDSFVHYVKKADTQQNIGVILWATTSQFTFDIPYNIEITDPKVQNECDMYRLCSPNFAGQFEFSAAMNGGVNYFNVDCSYKPFNPYIHINPNFGGLYGQDFDDARGLICGGDFSLPQTSNAWANYELNNKNYNNIFDRTIQNMEVNNAIQREQQSWGIAAGTVGAVAGGGGSGAMIGGPVGALAGGILGGAASLAGGIRDYQLSEQGRQEALNYYTDMYKYNLGNIKALPTSLAKTSALTYNNKIFPILEYYTCTDEEKQALRDKIKYNGMTVGRIGKIVDFIREEQSYIKGKLIRLTDIPEDFHVLNAIADEMNKGVFI